MDILVSTIHVYKSTLYNKVILNNTSQSQDVFMKHLTRLFAHDRLEETFYISPKFHGASEKILLDYMYLK